METQVSNKDISGKSNQPELKENNQKDENHKHNKGHHHGEHYHEH